jgi:hypothetical protein
MNTETPTGLCITSSESLPHVEHITCTREQARGFFESAKAIKIFINIGTLAVNASMLVTLPRAAALRICEDCPVPLIELTRWRDDNSIVIRTL